jgi:LuxR family maltose regulon positive regulatory protein
MLLHQHELLLRSRLELAEAHPAAALALLATIDDQAALPICCERALLQAVAYQIQADQSHALLPQQQALDALAQALALAAPQKLRLPFLNAPPQAAELLRKLAGQSPHLEFAASLLAQAAQDTPDRLALADPLSQREQDVLRLLAAGLTNAQIAETLVVAPSTVKTHVNRILAKLAAANRTQAVARARELGLLPS